MSSEDQTLTADYSQLHGSSEIQPGEGECRDNEFIDLTSKISAEEMKVSPSRVRYQIFVPEVHDVDWKFNSPEKLTLFFTSKDNKFLKTHSSGGKDYFTVKLNVKQELIDETQICIRSVRRKTFELEYVFKRGREPIPQAPPPPKGVPSVRTNLQTKKSKPVGTDAPTTKETGYTGLVNVGNTCFMASVIQCLSNIPALRDYFLFQDFQNHINSDNPLGTGGAMANAFHFLLTQLWSGKNKSVKPTKVKEVVGERAPQFQGYSQHDAQEFCAYILDLLHEDVNLVRTKPYTEVKEADGRPDKEVANEAWDIFSKRNRSKIVELFYGQYKSNLRCPKCENQSITFDPFVYLSVPLPRELRKLNVLFFFASPSKRPRRFELHVSKKGGSAREIYLQVSKLTNVKLNDLRLLVSYKNRIHKVYSEKDELDDIDSTSEVIVSEVVENEDTVTIAISHRKELKRVSDPDKCQCCGVAHSDTRLKRCAKCKDVWYCSQECIKKNYKYHKTDCTVSKEFIGNPLFVSVPRTIKRKVLHKLLEDYAAFSIDYSWSEESLERQKNVTSDYETPPSSPDSSDDGTTTVHAAGMAPFRVVATTQHGIENMEVNKEMTLEEDVYKLDDVKFLTAEWLNDKHRVNKSEPSLESVNSVDHDNIRCDRVSSYDDTVTLERCIELFSEEETLEENDFWYCGKCKEHVAAQKQLTLWKLPKVLIFHLKRFHYRQSNSYSLRRDKINKLVEYEVDHLDMSPYVIDPDEACGGRPPEYELCGVVNHMGSMSFGHYTAYVRHPDKKHQWRIADDSNVRDVRPSSVVTDNGYLLFYILKDEKEEETEKVRTVSMEDLESDICKMKMNKQNGNHYDNESELDNNEGKPQESEEEEDGSPKEEDNLE